MNNTVSTASEKDFSEILQNVSKDWSLLDDLQEKRFVLEKKHKKVDMNDIANEILETVKKEEALHKEQDTQDEKAFKNATFKEESFIAPQSLEENVKKPIVLEKSQSLQIVPTFMQSPKPSNTIWKMLALGLTKLYIKKTNEVLNPLKFMMENSKKVLMAIVDIFMPLLMSWYLITQVGFIHTQLQKEAPLMFWIYCGIFYFASLFVWVSTKVVLAGIYAMFKNVALDIIKSVETEKTNKLE